MSRTSATQDRVIRVFVSSTFRDMQAERDELVLRIFPQLRRLCEERGVTWGEIDLRWGITEEQSQRGEVLPICLEEIKRCRPYFIGLLGERYGWIPTTISDEVLEREPWIKRHADGEDKKSVTELEILHGVLNNPEMADHAFFYFRDPTLIDRLSADQKQADFVSENDQSLQKLNRLKDDIRQQHREGKLKYEPRENYPDAKSLGERVLADFTALIDTLYPQGQEPSPLERERMDHDAFARSRAGVYIGRQEYFDRLDAHVASDAAPLVVMGESGSGKSALLANWALRYREQHPEDFLLLHFIGASPDSADANGLLRRIMLELKQRFHLPDDVPAQPDKIREAFPYWLAQTAGHVKAAKRSGHSPRNFLNTVGQFFQSLNAWVDRICGLTQKSQPTCRIVLVLDALNQLEDIHNAPDLGWLPRELPRNCRLIVSALPGRSLTALGNRGWLDATLPLKVQPLEEAERRRLVTDFLHQHARDLGRARTDRVVRGEQASNPLYLRVLLDELRMMGRHESLDRQLMDYLSATDPKALYLKIIARWEQVYGEGREVVSRSLRLIWAARRGLSAAELLDLLGQNRQPLPGIHWTPFYLAAESALTTRSGLLSFAHDYLRQAVQQRYLTDSTGQCETHRELADYFARQAVWTMRKLDELPWQLAAARQWPRLHETLTDEQCFVGLQQRSEFELLGYWLQLNPQFDLATSYTAAFARWTKDWGETRKLGDLAKDLGHFLFTTASHAAAEPLMRRALEIEERIAQRLVTMSELPISEGLGCLPVIETQLRNTHRNLSVHLANLAWLLKETNRMAEAEPLMLRVLEIVEQLEGPDHADVAIHINNLALLLVETNRLAEAERLHRRALAIDEQSNGAEHPNVARDLNNLARLLMVLNRLPEAEPLMRRGLMIEENCRGADHPIVAVNLANLAWLLKETGRFAEAERLMRRALKIDEQAFGSNHPNVAMRLNNLAALFHDTNRLSEAEPLMRRGLVIEQNYRGADHPSVATQLNNLAGLLLATNRLAKAEPLIRRALKIDEQSFGPKHPNVARDLNALAQLLQTTNRLAEAEPLMRRALEINERSFGPEHPEVSIDLNNLACLLSSMNRFVEAERLMRRVLEIAERSFGPEHPNVATVRNNLAQLAGKQFSSLCLK